VENEKAHYLCFLYRHLCGISITDIHGYKQGEKNSSRILDYRRAEAFYKPFIAAIPEAVSKTKCTYVVPDDK
jgi:hypothetical protein